MIGVAFSAAFPFFAEPPLLEASGGIDLETIAGFAQTGVDRISTGWITHSSPALDVALDFLPLES